MSKDIVPRGWLSVEEAGRYAGISPEHIKRAIEERELQAYVKPVTRRSEGRHVFYKVAVEDVDRWIRSHWEEA